VDVLLLDKTDDDSGTVAATQFLPAAGVEERHLPMRSAFLAGGRNSGRTIHRVLAKGAVQPSRFATFYPRATFIPSPHKPDVESTVTAAKCEGRLEGQTRLCEAAQTEFRRAARLCS